MIIHVAPQASIATTPSPSSPEEGTTQGAAGKENSQILKFLIKKIDMRLSKNFTLEEMVATSHRRLQDTPTLAVVQNLQRLCVLVLQPLRDTIGAPVYINSGYRSKRLNARVGGVPNSRHLQGKAADIHCDNLDYAKVIFDILRQNPNVDKAIIEKKGHSVWVHVQM